MNDITRDPVTLLTDDEFRELEAYYLDEIARLERQLCEQKKRYRLLLRNEVAPAITEKHRPTAREFLAQGMRCFRKRRLK